LSGLVVAIAVADNVVESAHERAVPVLFKKTHQSELSAQQVLQTQNWVQLERGLGNAFVQAPSAMVQVYVEQKQFQPFGQVVDVSHGFWLLQWSQ